MTLTLREASAADRAGWSAFLASRPEADVLQSWAWGEAGAGEPGEHWSRLVVVDGNGHIRGLAQVLAREADLIVIDEPTAGIDAGGRELYLDAFAAELQRGAAIVTATHDIAEAVEYDQVLLLARRVVALGAGRDVLTPDQLMETFGIVIQDPHEEHAGRFTVAEVAHGSPQTIETRCQDDEEDGADC